MTSHMLCGCCVWLVLVVGVRSALYRRGLDSHPEAVCLDGLPAAFYHSQPHHKTHRNVLIFMQGGGYCHRTDICTLRCLLAPRLCTTPAEHARKQHGVLSDLEWINPAFHSYFKVDIPYCSGDMYIGDRGPSSGTGGYHFRGRKILDATLDSLQSLVDVSNLQNIVLSGSSAGGAGVVFNCDHVAKRFPQSRVHCIVDAALFYPDHMDPLHTGFNCDDPIERVLAEGLPLWNSHVERSEFDLDRWWRHVRQHLFISSAQYDLFGLGVYCGNVTDQRDLQRWGRQERRKIQQVTPEKDIGLFAPSCLRHELLVSDAWYSRLPAGGVTLARALDNWMTGDSRTHAWDECMLHTDQPCNKHCLVL